MSTDKRLQSEEAPTEHLAKSLPADGRCTESKRNWVEWGKTAGKVSDDFMPGRIDDLPKD